MYYVFESARFFYELTFYLTIFSKKSSDSFRDDIFFLDFVYPIVVPFFIKCEYQSCIIDLESCWFEVHGESWFYSF